MTRAAAPRALPARISGIVARVQQVGKADPVQHLIADPIDDAESDLGPILCWVDMNAEWASAERRIHDLDDRVGDRATGCDARSADLRCARLTRTPRRAERSCRSRGPSHGRAAFA